MFVYATNRAAVKKEEQKAMRHSVALVLGFFVSACSGEGLVEPETGTLEITTTTTGAIVSDGYTIKIDGAPAQPIGHNALVRRTGIATGSHSVELGGLPSGCTTAGENSRTITVMAGSTAAVAFAITCAAPTGAIRVITTTAGEAVAPYGLLLDGTSQGSIESNGSRVLEGVSPGPHTVGLSDLPGNCEIEEGATRTVPVTTEATVEVTFLLACGAGAIRVVTTTAGEAPPEYGLLLDEISQGSIEPTGSRVLEGVSLGTHTVGLSVPDDCGVDEGTRSIAVKAGATVEASFLVLCGVGGIRLVTTTTGEESPANYGLVLDGIDQGPMVSTGTRILTGLSSGSHNLALSGIPSECQVAGENPFTVTVYAPYIATEYFNLYCGATAGWSLQSSLGGSAIWGSSGTDVYALGSGVILHYDGLTWSTLYRGDGEGPTGIWGSSPRDVFVVGGWNIHADESPTRDGLILHYDGSSWTLMNPPVLDYFASQGSYHAVWGASGTDVFAVGKENSGETTSNEALVAHYDGTEWSRMTIPRNSESLDDVHGTSGRDVWAVSNYVGPFLGGPYSSIWHYDGTEWDVSTGYEGLNLSGIWASSATSVFAVGGGERGEVFHYNGVTWSSMTVPPTGYLREIWGTSDKNVYAVGQNGILHFDGTRWTDMGVNRRMYDIWGASALDVFAIGESILHRSP